jgi:pimeloyl-ACP methyl ester carboxylesterase
MPAPRILIIRIFGSVLTAIMATNFVLVGAAAQEPLRIAKQGSVEAGGELVFCPTNDGGDPKSQRWPPGRVVVNHVYATYQYPANQTYKYPILFNPGGGHSARVYDTTPDGREGWLTLFVREGFAVYGVDRVNTGRAGSDICKINAVRLGVAPVAQMPAINRYSTEAAWIAFRWGPQYGTWYPDTQFPTEALDNYTAQLLSTYRDPQELEKSVAALVALLEKVGPSILESWSSGGLIIYKTAIARPDLVKGILALENAPNAFEAISDDEVKRLVKVPIFNIIADRNDESVEGARKFQKRMQAAGGHFTVDVLPEAGIHGNGHTIMLEKNNKEIMYRMINWLRSNVPDDD